jgi:beta-galactosidase
MTNRTIEHSVGGFLEVPGSGRVVHNFNVGWRFRKGTAEGADAEAFDDGDWPVVSAPHGLEVLPLEASGGVNYQGEAWYRKRFAVRAELEGKRVVLHFEGVMGKSRFWVNGKLIKEHFGGYLPCVLDVTEAVVAGEENLIAVWADNSDDPNYPPGKPQSTLDFAYFGGLYRDVWMITTNKVHVTDPNAVDVVAGGGVFVHFEAVSDEQATVVVETHVANGSGEGGALRVASCITDEAGNNAGDAVTALHLGSGEDATVTQRLVVPEPRLWHVDEPYLHELVINVTDADGVVLDAVRLRIGIRSIEFKGKAGFFLNGKPFDGKLIGTNRHQDYAYVGNAVSNEAHWRDAIKLRAAGMRVIRCAHYPQDPAFMDACDALGMFVIITTPGWQFWNADPVFEARVFADIRNMVRRDRNRPSGWLWEPILNETDYPDYFAERVHQITHEEYPHPGCYTACDRGAEGQEHFDVVYAQVYQSQQIEEKSAENHARLQFDYATEERCIFTREWGDCPADWRAQSSPSRVNKAWGERAQLMQASHYADPDYVFGSTYESLCAAPSQHVGGTLWHGVDHQRGYHADAFWGGFLDATRQPKYADAMFRSQVPADACLPWVATGPFVEVAHLMHPSSDGDVTVFSNCDEVRLVVNGELFGCLSTHPEGTHMPHHPVVFEGAFRFFRHGLKGQCLKAEGLIDGEVVATATRRTWDRRQNLVVTVDLCGAPLVADGSDFVPVVVRIVDKHGEVVRLTDDTIRFTVVGPAELIGEGVAAINPQTLNFGEAVILVRAGLTAGTITVRAESAHGGVCKPLVGEVSFESVAPARNSIFTEAPEVGRVAEPLSDEAVNVAQLKATVARLAAEVTEMKAAGVELQQEARM